jgi:regulator of ribonuclease activity A
VKLESDGHGKVLVVDGGGSTCCALLGNQLALLAAKNGGAGVIVNGCIRDSHDIASIAVGVKAHGTMPRRSNKNNTGEADIEVQFANVALTPGHYLFADRDGIVIAANRLPASASLKDSAGFGGIAEPMKAPLKNTPTSPSQSRL